MSFVQKNLSTNEKILYSTGTHWYVYLNGIILLTLGFIIPSSASNNKDDSTSTIVAILILAGIILLINSILIARSSEFVVTNKRVILKTGVLKRKLIEVQLNRAEGLTISQGIMGRVFNFGVMKITSGGVTEVFTKIAKPYEFKKQVNNAIEGSFVVNPGQPSM